MSAISRSAVSIRIFGKFLDPDQITALLGCSPSTSGKTDEIIFSESGIPRKIRKGFWFIENGESDAVDLEEKINLLLDKLTGNLEVWQQITREYKADIFCGLFMNNINEGFTFTPTLMRKLADRNVKIGFDIYTSVNTLPDK